MTQSNKGFIIGAIAVIALLIGVTFFSTFYMRKSAIGNAMVEDVQHLATILNRIHATCQVRDFDNQKNPINFLNVGSFAGSEVGSMNLVYPNKWEGPYLIDNPTMQGKEYQEVRTKRGHFVTPGDGVKLPNGKIVGTDIKLDKKADIAGLGAKADGLMYNNKALAIKLDF